MHFVFLVNVDIPEREQFYNALYEKNVYEKLMFVKVTNEEDIKLYLCKLESPPGSKDAIYFVIRSEDDVVAKSKILSYYREYDLYSSHNIQHFIEMFDSGAMTEKGLKKLTKLPENYNYEYDGKVHVYNIGNKYRPSTVEVFLTAKDENDAYMKELDQDHNINGSFSDRIFIYVDKGTGYLKSINKTMDWRLEKTSISSFAAYDLTRLETRIDNDETFFKQCEDQLIEHKKEQVRRMERKKEMIRQREEREQRELKVSRSELTIH